MKNAKLRLQPQTNQQKLQEVLSEIVQHNNDIASEQIESLLNKYFTQDPDTGSYTPIMISMSIPTPASAEEIQVDIPLLTTVPISFFAIEEAEVYPEVDESGLNKKEISKKLEYSKYGYNTIITCKQQPLPSGISLLINMLTNNIAPRQK